MSVNVTGFVKNVNFFVEKNKQVNLLVFLESKLRTFIVLGYKNAY